MKRSHEIKIGKRRFPISFSLATMKRIQEKNDKFDITEVSEIILKDTGMLIDTLYEMMVSGAALTGDNLDVSAEWVGEHLFPSREVLTNLRVSVIDTLVDAMSSEMGDEIDGGEVDVVLEELQKKS